jgi:hypothetical protein
MKHNIDKPTKEQIQVFYEWCGFEYRQGTGEYALWGHWWDGSMYDKFPRICLENLFKYAVPKLQQEGWGCRVQSSPLRDNDTGKEIYAWTGYASIFYVRYDNTSLTKRDYYAIDPNPALALFWAIWELIKSEIPHSP